MPKKQTLTGELYQMEVGEERDYPAARCATLRAMASLVGFRYDRIYSTSIDRERRVLTVTRKS